MPRQSFNPKRRFDSAPAESDLAGLRKVVRYGGNPEHKRNPGDFGLQPPARHGGDNSLCDAAGITSQAEATRLLLEGVRRGLISEQRRGDRRYPQNVWAVSKDGVPLEAQLENAEGGVYHGYPMPQADPLRDEVLRRWNQRG